MGTIKLKYVPYLFGVAVVLILLALIFQNIPFLQLSWENEMLHTLVESIEAVAAIVIAMILFKREEQDFRGRNFLMAMGFLGMGIVGLFHSVASPGQGFVFLHCLTNIVSSTFFVLAVLPRIGEYFSAKRWMPWLITLASLLLGAWVLILPETIPIRMINNEFTAFAVILNLIAGGFFMIVGVRLLIDFYRTQKKEVLFFSFFFFLFSVSSFTFKFSTLWDGYWWGWHFARLSAFVFIIIILGQNYLLILSRLKRTLFERQQVEEELSQSEEKYRLMFENILNAFAYHKIVTDKNGIPIDYTFLEINDGFEKLTGLKREDIIGKNVTEVLPGIEKDPVDWIGRYGEIALQGKDIKFESFSEPIKKWYSIYAYSPQPGYFATIFDDISITLIQGSRFYLSMRFSLYLYAYMYCPLFPSLLH